MVADLCYHRWKPELGQPLGMRLFGAGVPIVLYTAYFLTLYVLGGVWWPIHVSTGAIVFAAATGFFVSYLVVSPALPSRSSEQLGRGAMTS
jgi:hypothetical protein